MTYFEGFSFLNTDYIGKSITLMFKLRVPREKNSKLGGRCFCLFCPAAIMVPIRMDTNMAFPYKAHKFWSLSVEGFDIYF